MGQLRKMDVKRADYFKTEKVKKEVEKLESQMIVASQAIETISAEIIKVRETQLYPQLLELVKGLVLFKLLCGSLFMPFITNKQTGTFFSSVCSLLFPFTYKT